METSVFADRYLSVRGFGAAGAAGFRAIADLVLPPQCLACLRRVAEQGGLCPSCWAGLKPIERPYCEQLGTPFAYDLGEGALSPQAIADPPPFGRCRAVAIFDDVSKNLVHGLKYRDRLDISTWMANWMARAGADLLLDADVVIPIPLHRWRLWSRRFNQSACLAQAVASQAGKPVATGALRRIKPTRQQVGLSASERDRNVRGAFEVAESHNFSVSGRTILLVDDVYTTGATVKSATRALIRAGARAVDVLVFARVVHGAGEPIS